MYRVKKQAIKELYGTPTWQYATLVSRLEHIKKNDPQYLILLKVFSDQLPDGYISAHREDQSMISGLTSWGSSPSERFCLRFGAIAVTPGTAVRRHQFNKHHGYAAMKVNASMDACHLSGDAHGCITDIIQPLATNDYILDTFSVDSLGECRDVWFLSLSCDKEALSRSPDHSFCGDRLKGQDNVNQHVYPHVSFPKCHFHIQANIKSHGGSDPDVILFQNIAYARTDNVRHQLIRRLPYSRRPKEVRNYFKLSLIPEKDKWEVYTMGGCKEGLFTCQPSESFHQVLKQKHIRSTPMVFIP